MNKIINAINLYKIVLIIVFIVVLVFTVKYIRFDDAGNSVHDSDFNKPIISTIVTDSSIKLLLNATTSPIDTTNWISDTDDNFDISFKYPSSWFLSTNTDENGAYILTVTNSDLNNVFKIFYTNYENCGGNGYDQPELRGYKVSDSNWGIRETYILRSVCFTDKQVVIYMSAGSIQAKSIEEQILNTISFAKNDPKAWKHFSNSNLGLEFDYPTYLGHVIVEKGSRGCPEMKTYSRNGQLPTEDYNIWFTNMQRIGVGGSYMDYHISVIRTENNVNICGKDLLDFRKDIIRDPKYQSSEFPHQFASNAYVSTVDTTIGTSVNQFYTLYFIKRNMINVIQPNITFIPVAGSDEAKEISKNETPDDPFSSIVNFVLHHDNAKKIRDYLHDFRKIVDTIKVND